MTQIAIRSKIWLEVAGQPFLGDGRYRLLAAIEQSGSINAAAKQLGMSYRKAWSQLKVMEEHASFPLLERRIGGKGGGETLLTAETQHLMQGFRQLRDRVNQAADQYFSESFPPC